MPGPLRHASIDWSQGTPLASDFGDVYFCREDGAAETRHVFHARNQLPERFATLGEGGGFTIVETGFGTGLNWLATMALWREGSAAGWLHYASVEKFPLSPGDLARAQAMWPAYADFAAALQSRLPPLVPGFHRIVFPRWRSTLTLFFGDISDFLPRLSATVDAWFLDGFAPARNPGMWAPGLYAGMAALSRPGATFATFTAAGAVRRGLEAEGFAVSRVPGHGRKRDMLCGRLKAGAARGGKSRTSPWLQRPAYGNGERHACVIGAGIAGAETAHRLALRGWTVTVLERDLPARGGSGNPAAVLHPRLAPAAMALDHFPQSAWLFAVQALEQRQDGVAWHACGLLQLLAGNAAAAADHPAAGATASALAERLSATAASRKAGVTLHHDALWFPRAGWLVPQDYIAALLDTPGITLLTHADVAQLERGSDDAWHIRAADGSLLAQAPVVIVANAFDARRLAPLAQLPLQVMRGQISLPPASAATRALTTLVCHNGYLTPALPDGRHCLGATFQPHCDDTTVTPADHVTNHLQLQEVMPAFAAALPPVADWQGRAALRCQSPDYLPLLGPVPDREAFLRDYAGLVDGKVMDYPDLPVLPGLHVNIAHGSRGFGQAALAAEILAAELDGEPYPVSRQVLDALHPARFWVRELRRQKRKGRQAPA